MIFPYFWNMGNAKHCPVYSSNKASAAAPPPSAQALAKPPAGWADEEGAQASEFQTTPVTVSGSIRAREELPEVQKARAFCFSEAHTPWPSWIHSPSALVLPLSWLSPYSFQADLSLGFLNLLFLSETQES